MNRRYRRKHHPGPVTLFLLLVATAAVLNVYALAVRLLPWLLGAAVVAGTAMLARRLSHRRAIPPRPQKMIRTPDAEVIRLRAEVEALRAQLDDARAARPDARPDARSRLLSDPRSGAHPLDGDR